jgi:hypothetical protein
VTLSDGSEDARQTRRTFLGALLLLAACGQPAGPEGQTRILLFEGDGVSPGSAAAIARILRQLDLAFTSLNSRDMNAMKPDRLRSFSLLIIPGGNFEVIGKALSAQASANIRAGVQAGLNYLGLCAGAFFAGASPYNGANLTDGVRFNFHALSAQGIRKTVVPITIAGRPPVEHYWEDGPELSGWGEPVALYPDGTPAVVQGRIGKGWVVLTGVHPEADESWRKGMGFTQPADASLAFAKELILAAYEGRPVAKA